jgi:hypothetical protein
MGPEGRVCHGYRKYIITVPHFIYVPVFGDDGKAEREAAAVLPFGILDSKCVASQNDRHESKFIAPNLLSVALPEVLALC